ncbi:MULTISPECIES: GumC family protein [Sphingomonas]|jgi:capsular exopolysaccharide synthesis family protein|uniref:GumC family protein n=1 Tax=Sphingomonas TaxID=13687 RepID=UPI0025519821|nr:MULTISPECIES: polysaccharide biosynthesis tyrosine autokinase [Sphingomonas]MDK8188074.1 polysaccharide biosynthesis tyrosine autokinase [Sphingomonas zeae]MDK8217750.1 polysaccharide biosynthesis tyrosine autokinase [Sphingomonas sp. UMB7805-LC452B]
MSNMVSPAAPFMAPEPLQPLQREGMEQTSQPILLQYWNTALRWRWLMVGIIVACVVAGLVLTLLTSPKYTARTQVEISRQQKQVTNVEGLESEEAGRDQEFYSTQYALLATRPLAERVASQLNLVNSREFFDGHGLDWDYPDERDGKNAAQIRKERQKLVVDTLLKNIDISPVRTSRLVEIYYTSRSPDLSARISNKWATAFIELSMDRQFASTADARRFLENRLVSLRQRLEESERQAVLFASRSGIVTIEQQRDRDGRSVGSRTLTTSNLEELSTALNQAIAARIAAQSRASSQGENSGEALNNLTLTNLRQQRAVAAAEYAKLLVNFEPQYPAARAIAGQIRTIDSAIARETGRISSVRQREYQEAVSRENELRQQVAAVRSELDTQNRSNIQYAIYQREADTNRQLYDALLQRYKEIGVAGSIGANNITVVEPAIVPEKPSSPKLLLNLAVALVLGIGLAAVTAIVLEQIDEGVRDVTQVEPLFKLPLLGTTPAIKGNAITELRDSKSQLFDSYFSIRSNLAFSTNHGFPRSLAIVSTVPGEGKSSTSLSLATVLGRTGKRVLLVDADMRSPSIHHMAGVENEAGFSNYLAGEDNWRGLVRDTDTRNVAIIAAGPLPPSAAELLSGDRLRSFVQDALTQYDHVIIDSPPVLGLTDAPLIANAVEGIVYIVQWAGPATRGIQASIKRLQLVNAHIFGIVLTKVETSREGYGYTYGERYGEQG